MIHPVGRVTNSFSELVCLIAVLFFSSWKRRHLLLHQLCIERCKELLNVKAVNNFIINVGLLIHELPLP